MAVSLQAQINRLFVALTSHTPLDEILTMKSDLDRSTSNVDHVELMMEIDQAGVTQQNYPWLLKILCNYINKNIRIVLNTKTLRIASEKLPHNVRIVLQPEWNGSIKPSPALLQKYKQEEQEEQQE